MPRKPHPADAFNAGIVANATAWSAFTQAAGRIVRHFQTEADARQAAQVMADGFRRPALVYAIDAQGRTAVADTIHPSSNQPTKESTMSETTTKTYAKRFNAQRAARKLLGDAAQEGEAFRTFKAPNGEWDFETLTAQATTDADPEADDLAVPGFLRRDVAAETEVVEAAPPATERVEAGDPEFAARVEAKREAKRQRGKKLAEARAASRPQPKAEAAPTGKRAAIEEAVRQGHLPTPPDFSAATHARFRAKLAKLVELAEAGDAECLKAIAINPVSTSPRAMARYRDLAVIAIEARAAKAA